MERIGSRLGHYVYLAAAVVPVLGVKVIGYDAEFGDGIEIWNYGSPVVLALFHVRPVDHEPIGGLALAIHGLVSRIQTSVDRSIADARRLAVGCGIGRDTRLQ